VEDFVVGVLAVAVGALFCFRGWLAMRIVIPIWGAFAGFVFGAGLIDAGSDERFLRTFLGWIVGIAFALLFAALAYFLYEVAIVLAMGAIGFALGTGLMTALGISWSWLVVLVGVAAGVLLAVAAIFADVPALALVVLGAMAGAVTIVAGLMLLFGSVDTADFGSSAVTERLDDDWWWYALYVILAIAGVIGQIIWAGRIDGTVRDAWAGAGEEEVRSA
jgi:hypothetical protein